MRIATYNVEWFNSLFDDEAHLLADGEWSGRQDVTRAEQIAALTTVFQALDADAIMVIEAPDTNGKRHTVPALERFAAHAGIRASKALLGFPNETQQEIALLYDPDALQAVHDPVGEETGKKGRPGAPRFDGAFRWDLDVDATSEVVTFSKPPLEVAAISKAGTPFRLIGVHVKSKAPHGARSPEEVMRVSIQNRRKQLAQCIWLRARVDQHLEAGDSLIVLGDMNDGPGLDEYERLFGRSGVEIVMGEEGAHALFDPHARMGMMRRFSAMPTTARFYVQSRGRYLQALLDYIMVSQDLRSRGPNWRIWHPHDDPECSANDALCRALLTASDHFPVSIDLEI